jgi:hypothetical protein
MLKFPSEKQCDIGKVMNMNCHVIETAVKLRKRVKWCKVGSVRAVYSEVMCGVRFSWRYQQYTLLEFDTVIFSR